MPARHRRRTFTVNGRVQRVVERVLTDIGHAVGNDDTCNVQKITESMTLNGCSLCGCCEVSQRFTAAEGVLADLIQFITNLNIGKRYTVIKRASADGSEAFGNNDVGERLALVERVLGDDRRAASKLDLNKALALIEGTDTHFLYAIGNLDLDKSATVERAGTDMLYSLFEGYRMFDKGLCDLTCFFVYLLDDLGGAESDTTEEGIITDILTRSGDLKSVYLVCVECRSSNAFKRVGKNEVKVIFISVCGVLATVEGVIANESQL